MDGDRRAPASRPSAINPASASTDGMTPTSACRARSDTTPDGSSAAGAGGGGLSQVRDQSPHQSA